VCRARLSGDGTELVISLCDILCELSEPHGGRGDVCEENHSTANGGHLSGHRSKARHTPVVDLCNDM
jgi:hypothetical protein